MRYLDEVNLQDIATGAALLGTGGGGNPYIGYLIGREAVRKNGPIQLVSVEELLTRFEEFDTLFEVRCCVYRTQECSCSLALGCLHTSPRRSHTG